MSKTKAVLFDFDGVLVDTFDISYAIYKENTNLPEEAYRSRFEGNVNDVIDAHVVTLPDDYWTVGFWQRYTPELMKQSTIPGLDAIVTELSQEYQLFIISSSISSAIIDFLKANKLAGHFERILGNDVHTSKVKKIQMVLNEFHLEPLSTVFVTDTLGDIKEATQANVRSIAVPWGFHPIETLQKGNPTEICHTPEDLTDMIRKLLD